MFVRILGIILPVFLIVAIGYAYGRWRRPDLTAFNRIQIEVLVPMLVFSSLASKDFDLVGNQALLLGGMAVVVGSGLLAWPVCALLREDPRTFVPPMMFNNCGNMGLPLAVLAFGPAGLGPAVALFVTCNLLQFTLGARIVSPAASPWRVFRNPIVLATVTGTVFALWHIPVPDPLMLSLKLLGDTTISLMLFSLGVRMLSINLRGWMLGLVAAVVCPVSGLIAAWAIAPWLGLDDRQYGLLMLFASLPPAVLNFLVAEQYQQEPDKVASIVLFGNLGALVFVPIGLAIGLAR